VSVSEAYLRSVVRARGGPRRGQAGRLPRGLLFELRRQGFLPSDHFVQRLLERSRALGVRFDPRPFRSEFLRARHFRQTRPGYKTRIALVRGIPIVYRLGGPAGDTIVLVTIWDGPLPPIEAIRPPQLARMREAESARIRRFTCSDADRRAVEGVVGRAVSAAAARGAVLAAAENAAAWAIAAADTLDRRPRSAATRRLFREAFGTTPGFVPSWRPARARWADRGALTAIRLRDAAQILRGGSIDYYCWGRPAYCPECTDSPPNYYACSSWGRRYGICLGRDFWLDFRNGRRVSMGATLLHEAIHIYFGRLIEHQERERYGNVNCYVRFALRAAGRPLPPRIVTRCRAA
jgi:hypothetical protein